MPAHQELCLHSLKGLLLRHIPHDMFLVDEGEGVADCHSLLEPVRPAKGILLHLSEAAVHHRQNPLQVRLQTHTAGIQATDMQVKRVESIPIVALCVHGVVKPLVAALLTDQATNRQTCLFFSFFSLFEFL